MLRRGGEYGEGREGIPSGVTRVGVTRGGNWWCHPIFSSKNLTAFLVIASESDLLFSCRLLTTPNFPRRLSSVVSKFSNKKNVILGRVSPPWRVSSRVRPFLASSP